MYKTVLFTYVMYRVQRVGLNIIVFYYDMNYYIVIIVSGRVGAGSNAALSLAASRAIGATLEVTCLSPVAVFNTSSY